MKKPTYIEGAVLAIAVTLVAVCLTLCSVVGHLNTTLSKLDQAIDSANGEVAKIDTTRKSVDDLLVQTTTLVIDADDAATKESSVLDSVNVQMITTLGHLDETVMSFNKNQTDISLHTVQSLDSISDTLKAAKPAIENLNATVVETNATIASADRLISDPAIPKLIDSGQRLTESAAGLVQDGKEEADKFVHPQKKKLTFMVGLNATVDWMCSHLIPPLF